LYKKTTKIILGNSSGKTNNILYVQEKDFLPLPSDTTSVLFSIDQLRNIQHSKINDKKFPELFLYNGLSIWWLCYPEISHLFINPINFTKNFLKFVQEQKPQLIQVKEGFVYLPVISDICKKQDIKLKYSKFNYLRFVLKMKIKQFLQKIRAKIIIEKKIQSRKKLFVKIKTKTPNLEKKIIFTSYPPYRDEIINTLKNKIEKGEIILSHIKNLIEKNEKIIGIDLFSNFSSNNEILYERLKDDAINWTPIESFLESFKLTKSQKKFLKNYDSLISSQQFKNLFNYEGINYWSTLEHHFQRMTNYYNIPYWIFIFDSLKKRLSIDKPKVIFLPYENGPISLAFITICKQLGIKSIGLQHGIIVDAQPFYSMDDFYTEKNISGFPFPDKMLLYGPIPKKILLDKGYPEQNLVNFGNTEFFNLEKIFTILNTSKTHQKYKINKSKKIILYLSSGYQRDFRKNYTFHYDEISWRQILEKFGNKEDFSIILKPHPRENSFVYQKIMDEYNLKNVKIIQGNLHEILFISDIIICTLSTTIIDAFCIKKPVIQLKFPRTNFEYPYSDSCVLISTIDSLEESVYRIIKEKSLIKNMEKNSSLFIKNYYNIPEENPQSILKKLLEKN
jgi:CDP-glycerol glycerophosphotransferase (TagB/SpsB family)